MATKKETEKVRCCDFNELNTKIWVPVLVNTNNPRGIIDILDFNSNRTLDIPRISIKPMDGIDWGYMSKSKKDVDTLKCFIIDKNYKGYKNIPEGNLREAAEKLHLSNSVKDWLKMLYETSDIKVGWAYAVDLYNEYQEQFYIGIYEKY